MGLYHAHLTRGSRHPRLACRKRRQVQLADLSKKDRGEAEREATILRCLQHPNIIQFIDSGVADATLWIAMEYARDGDLHDRIEKHRRTARKFTDVQFLGMFVQVRSICL